MERVLITGGTGCVGSNLAARLASAGIQVRILRRSTSDLRAIQDVPVEHAIGDILDPDSLLRAASGCDTVFHAAALISHRASRHDALHRVNVTGTRNVVGACIRGGIRRLVHVSSIAAVGHPRDGELATEETLFDANAKPGYSLSKYQAELEVAAGVAQGLDAVIVNPSVIVGERDIHFHGGQLIRDARRGMLLFYIDGGMNVVYVGDVVNGIIGAAEKGRKGERYVLCGENLTHRDIFQRTAALVGARAPLGRLPIPMLHAGARAIEAACTALRIDPWVTADLVENAGSLNWFSSAKAERELGYTVTPFDTTILAAYGWYKSNGFL